MIEAVKNVAGNAGGGLFGTEDFDGPVGLGVEGVGNATVFVDGQAFPLEDGNVGNDGASAKCATEFWKRPGNPIRFGHGVDSGDKFSLNRAVLALGHGFLDGVSIDVFAGGFGLWQLQKLLESDGFGGRLNHQPLPGLVMSDFKSNFSKWLRNWQTWIE